jgi:hypothetical protein
MEDTVSAQDETNLATGRAPTYARGDEVLNTDPERRGPTGDNAVLRYRITPLPRRRRARVRRLHTARLHE